MDINKKSDSKNRAAFFIGNRNWIEIVILKKMVRWLDCQRDVDHQTI